MFKNTLVGSTALMLALSINGCAVKTGNEQLGEMEKTQISQKIEKGKSTKQDVKSLFGDPDKTDFDNNGHEKWTYVHVRKDAKFVNYVPVANWFVGGTNDTTKSVVVLFHDDGVVKNYIVSDAKGETKAGLFQ